jgi:Mg/Co/Ni transporter MgtE
MAHKVSEKSLLRLAGAYARSFPKEVADDLTKTDADTAAQFLEAVEPGIAVDILDATSDALSAILLHKLSDDGFSRLVHRVHRHRLEKLKALHQGLAGRLEPKPAQP